jgi:phosphonate dehydrogenase
MNPSVLITRPVSPNAVDMLGKVCHILPRVEFGARRSLDFSMVAPCADALLMATPERVDDRLLSLMPRLRVIACTYRLPEHIDVSACTRRGIWITNVETRWLTNEAEIEAAQNILDVLSGDTPRRAVNDIFAPAA